MNFFKKMRREKMAKQAAADAIRRRYTALSVRYQDFALNRRDAGVAPSADGHLVVSLTTFPKRIDDLHLTIESLFQQSRKADTVVLWLSREEFSEADVPAVLWRQCERGLDIQFCDKNIRSYKKIIHTLKKYPDSRILTVDDDVIYPIDMIDQLCRAHTCQPDRVHCHRAHKIRCDAGGRPLRYDLWEGRTADTAASPFILPTGIGGVLYFPGCFDTEVLNEAAFTRLAPTADDIWLKAMTLKNGVMSQRVVDERDWWQRFIMIDGSQKYSLKRENKSSDSGNDAQFKAVFDAYDLWPCLVV